MEEKNKSKKRRNETVNEKEWSSFMALRHESPITAMTVMNDPYRLITGTQSNSIHVWELNEFSKIKKLTGHTRSILCLTTVKQILISSAADQSVRIWDGEQDFVCTRILSGKNGHALALLANPIDSRLFTGNQDTSIKYAPLDKMDDALVNWEMVKGHHGFVYCLAYGQSQDALFSGSSDEKIKAWDFKSLQNRGTMKGHSGSVLCLDFVGADFLFSGSQDKTIRCWDTESMQCRGVLKGHSDAVLSLCHTAGGEMQRLCSSSADSTIRIWDSHTLLCVQRLKAHEETVTKVVCYDNFLYTASLDATVNIWDIDLLLETHQPTAASGRSPSRETQAVMFSPKSSRTTRATDGSMIHLLKKFVRFQSVSAAPRAQDECWRAAKYLKSLISQLGADCRLEHCGVSVNPIVLGRLGRDPTKRTILICGHYDVQPADESDGWHTPPFVLTGRNGYLYGRGATDDKGPILCILFAIRELLIRGETCPNFVFLFQGEGENGSIGFQQAVQDNISMFQDIDLTFISNNYWLGDDVPCLTYGMRGCIELNLQVSGPAIDIHAGVDGGVIREPLHDLVQLLNKLVDPKTGQCLADNFTTDVRSIDEKEVELYQSIPFNVESYKKQLGVTKLTSEDSKEKILMGRWREPTISMTGITCSIANASIIPKRAAARVSVRTVPDQDPQTMLELLVKHVEKEFAALETTNTLNIEEKANVPWWLGDITNEYYKQMEQSLEKFWKIKPILVREGGTSPNTRYLEETIAAPCLHFPIGQSSDRAHLQNERIRLLNLSTSKEVLTDFFHKIALKIQ